MHFNVNLKQIKSDYTLTIHKMNKSFLGQIPINFLNSIKRELGGVDEVQLTIPKYITERFQFSKVINPLFNEIKEERLICLNDKEYFVIKNVVTTDDKLKSVTAKSKEVKLGKIDVNIEDYGLQMFTKDEETSIISLNDYLKQETGWKLGHVDDSIAYETDSEGNKREKVRWQESINSNWLDYFNNELKEQFECIADFDTYNNLVNLYHIDSFGDNIQLYLSHDNYIKSLERTTNSDDIVTRLKLEGSEDMDIIGATVTGYDYIENYSYFLDNKEMSEELSRAIKKYQEMNEIREPIWRELIDTKLKKQRERDDKSSEWLHVIETIKAKKDIKKTYDNPEHKDEVNSAKLAVEISELEDKKVILDVQIKHLEEEIAKLDESIKDINILCKRETSTDEDGYLIFNEVLLDELNEFLYYDTYTNDAFLKVEDLIAEGKRQLSLKCIPTKEWTLDVINFLDRIIDINFRQHWKGDLSMGDIIVLHSKESKEEELVYFTSFTQNLKNGKLDTLELTLSNKKIKEDDKRTIADYLTKAEHATRTLNSKRHLFIQQQKKRINLPDEYIPKKNIQKELM
ncbi:hypothetical protein RHI49_19545 [Clostridioides difficile]|nr:hypothetical protein [Clostridioides difficile]MDV9700813.1 hypothetical protein [Clostridioides difficile]MDV9708446.1 hypothetical protein [Clostridioides difficile]MDV9727603.1 hypothetical protein [Clostridioides difficile]MDV9742366.1 hypothetical protein [Clostridioides difficile]